MFYYNRTVGDSSPPKDRATVHNTTSVRGSLVQIPVGPKQVGHRRGEGTFPETSNVPLTKASDAEMLGVCGNSHFSSGIIKSKLF